MANWFSRAPRRIEVPKLRSRSEDLVTTRVDLVEFTPPLVEFLGRAAYVQLTLFENLSRAISTAPTTAAKAALGQAAELSITKHRALVAEISAAGGSAAEAMEPYTGSVDLFDRAVRGSDWFENVMTCYITAGFLDDFFQRLAAGLGGEASRRVAAIYDRESGAGVLEAQLMAGIEANPRLSSRLAMWGRRLLGDTMLVARSALTFSADHRGSDEERVEPVFTELIAAHTRRMDVLGLTA